MLPQRTWDARLARSPSQELQENLPPGYPKSGLVTLTAIQEQELTRPRTRVPQRLRWVEFRRITAAEPQRGITSPSQNSRLTEFEAQRLDFWRRVTPNRNFSGELSRNSCRIEKVRINGGIERTSVNPLAIVQSGRSKPKPGLLVGNRTPSLRMTAPAEGSSIKSRCPSRSA